LMPKQSYPDPWLVEAKFPSKTHPFSDVRKIQTMLGGAVAYQDTDYTFLKAEDMKTAGIVLRNKLPPGWRVWVTGGPYKMYDYYYEVDYKLKIVWVDFYSPRADVGHFIRVGAQKIAKKVFRKLKIPLLPYCPFCQEPVQKVEEKQERADGSTWHLQCAFTDDPSTKPGYGDPRFGEISHED